MPFDFVSMPQTVFVLLPIPADQPYSYAVPEGMDLTAGDFVQVPLGPRKVAAVVWDAPKQQNKKPLNPNKLKSVLIKFDCPPLRPDMRRFIDWVAHYTASKPGMVLRSLLVAPTALQAEPLQMGYRYKGGKPERLTKAREQVLRLASGMHDNASLASKDGEHKEPDFDYQTTSKALVWRKSALAEAAQTSSSVIDGLIKQGLFEEEPLPVLPVVAPPHPNAHAVVLSLEQQQAAKVLMTAVESKTFSTVLLDGITGSGKTEVYFEAVAKALQLGRQVLILLPEIALTTVFLARFEKRFGAPPAQWHSDMSPKMRERIWRQVALGQVRVVVGARSALFLPFKELGLVVVDEEHDGAYKQESHVFYNARDMAVVRASHGQFTCILSSATPSVESRVNAQAGRYQYVRMDKRHGAAVLPDLICVDMRKHPPARGKFLSPVMIKAITATLGRQEQALLFLNRRGYAPLTLCRVCGFRFECKNCSAWLVEHRSRNQLQCHHCGHSETVPEACHNCGTLDHLVACGPGVERLAEEVEEVFTNARILVLSSDMGGGVSQLRLQLEAIAEGAVDIVIGTQLVAKGHNFPHMSCVGVVDADLGLANGDPRAAERTFQLLSQVTGRAGRAGGKSYGLLQTYAPDHPVIEAIRGGDREAFYEREIALRQRSKLPPFSRLVALIVSSTDKRAAQTHANALRHKAPLEHQIMIMGPAEAPLAQVRGRFRYRLLLHTPRQFDVQRYLKAWLKDAPKERGNLRVQIDVDPQSFL